MTPPERDTADIDADNHRDAAAIGAEIRRRRESLKVTQQELAEAVGTTQQTIDRIEKGSVTFSRYLRPVLSALTLEEAKAQTDEAQERAAIAESRAIATGGHRPSIPVFEWRNGVVAAEAWEHCWAPDRMGTSTRGYGVRIWSPVHSPSGDPVFLPGDLLFIEPDEPPRHNGWCFIVGKADERQARFGLLADPNAMPPQVKPEQLIAWGYAVVNDETEGGFPVVAYAAADHAATLARRLTR